MDRSETQQPRRPASMRIIGGGLALAVALAGCGDLVPTNEGGAPEPKPTAKVLHEMRTASFPVYWTGPSFRGMKLSGAVKLKDRAVLEYGTPTCDSGSGCTYPLGIVSVLGQRDAFPARDDTPSSFGAACFQRDRGALLMGCVGDGDYDLLSGISDIGIELSVDHVAGTSVVRHLIPMNPRASSSRDLPPPARIGCRQFRSLPRWFAVEVPWSLRPTACH